MELKISAYNGPGFDEENGKPYIFISYSSADEERVFPIVQYLYDTGHRLWLFPVKDTNTEQYRSQYTKRVRHCYVFMAFVSDSYQNREDCKNEMNIFDINNLGKNKFVTMLEDLRLGDRNDDLIGFIGGIGVIDHFSMTPERYHSILDNDSKLKDCIDERFIRLKELEEKKKKLEEKKKKLDEEYLGKVRKCFEPLTDEKFLKELLTRSSDNASDFYSSRQFERVWKKLSLEQTDYQEDLESIKEDLERIENEIAELEASEAAERVVSEPVEEPVPEPEPEPVAEPAPEPEPAPEHDEETELTGEDFFRYYREHGDRFEPFRFTFDPLRPWTDEERAYMLDRITDRNRRLYIEEAKNALCRTIDGILNELFRMSEQGNREVERFLTNMAGTGGKMNTWIEERLDDDSMREIIRRFRTCRGYFDFRAVRTEFRLGDHYDNMLNKLCDYARCDREVYEQLCSFYDNQEWLRGCIENVIRWNNPAYNMVGQFKLIHDHTGRNNQ